MIKHQRKELTQMGLHYMQQHGNYQKNKQTNKQQDKQTTKQTNNKTNNQKHLGKNYRVT